MNKQYRKEKFESRDEALTWCADNKPTYDNDENIEYDPQGFEIATVSDFWQDWHKAIEIPQKKQLIEVWVNIYPDRLGGTYTSYKKAECAGGGYSMGIVKLSKEITIVDGKVVEDERDS